MTEFEVYSILKNNTDVQDYGEHEYDNSWLVPGVDNITEELTKRNYILIGWFYTYCPKFYTESLTLDIGIVCEDEFENRFWCHYSKKWLDEDLEEYERKMSDDYRGKA